MGDPQTPATGLNVSTPSFNPSPAELFDAGDSASPRRHTRPAIHAVLSRLRRRIRAYVLLEGAALLCVVCGVLFWLTLALDWSYFRLTALELPRWFREAIAVAAVVFGVGSLFLQKSEHVRNALTEARMQEAPGISVIVTDFSGDSARPLPESGAPVRLCARFKGQ